MFKPCWIAVMDSVVRVRTPVIVRKIVAHPRHLRQTAATAKMMIVTATAIVLTPNASVMQRALASAEMGFVIRTKTAAVVPVIVLLRQKGHLIHFTVAETASVKVTKHTTRISAPLTVKGPIAVMATAILMKTVLTVPRIAVGAVHTVVMVTVIQAKTSAIAAMTAVRRRRQRPIVPTASMRIVMRIPIAMMRIVQAILPARVLVIMMAFANRVKIAITAPMIVTASLVASLQTGIAVGMVLRKAPKAMEASVTVTTNR
jgi:hypothetical protein